MNKDDDIICKQFIKSEIYIENEDEKKLGVLGEEHHVHRTPRLRPTVDYLDSNNLDSKRRFGTMNSTSTPPDSFVRSGPLSA